MQKALLLNTNDSSTDGLIRISDIIHDRFFELDSISLDNSVLTIPFFKEFYDLSKPIGYPILGRSIIPKFKCYLQINHVNEYQIDDNEKVVEYDFESISFDYHSKHLSVLTNTTLKFVIIVNDFEVLIYRDEFPTACRKSWFFGL
jgi:hypothetical protein